MSEGKYNMMNDDDDDEASGFSARIASRKYENVRWAKLGSARLGSTTLIHGKATAAAAVTTLLLVWDGAGEMERELSCCWIN